MPGMGWEATSLRCSKERLPAGEDSRREAGDAGSSESQAQEEDARDNPAVSKLDAWSPCAGARRGFTWGATTSGANAAGAAGAYGCSRCACRTLCRGIASKRQNAHDRSKSDQGESKVVQAMRHFNTWDCFPNSPASEGIVRRSREESRTITRRSRSLSSSVARTIRARMGRAPPYGRNFPHISNMQ